MTHLLMSFRSRIKHTQNIQHCYRKQRNSMEESKTASPQQYQPQQWPTCPSQQRGRWVTILLSAIWMCNITADNTVTIKTQCHWDSYSSVLSGLSTAEPTGEPQPDTVDLGFSASASSVPLPNQTSPKPKSNNGKTPWTEPAHQQHKALMQWK